VIAPLRTPARRIAVAIALSALVHLTLLWLPQFQPAHSKVTLPPLTVRLAAPPKPAQPPAQAKPSPAKPVLVKPVQPLAKPEAPPPPQAAAAAPEKIPDNAPDKMEAVVALPLPNQIQLDYAVYDGSGIFKTGELHRQLEIHGDNYMLQSVRRTTGLGKLIGSGQANQFIQLAQISHGKIDPHGLQPETFSEEKISAGGTQKKLATFDWAAKKILFLNGSQSALPDAAQDTLSATFQLSLLPVKNREIIPLAISDGEQIENIEFEIGAEETISTPMGELRALHLRKIHMQGIPYYEIWLGVEYRLLPLKLRWVDGSGAASEEIVISDIRIADK